MLYASLTAERTSRRTIRDRSSASIRSIKTSHRLTRISDFKRFSRVVFGRFKDSKISRYILNV